jgi:cellulose synthase (UDP-forming)
MVLVSGLSTSASIDIMPSLRALRMQRRFRHSFWAEVYESVLASYITAPTLLAMINPKLGKFNVTAKGGTNAKNYFDWSISRPYLFLLLLNLIGFVVGTVHIVFAASSSEVQTTLLNLAWTLYNMLILGASVAAAREQRQVRDTHRVAMKMRAALTFPTGRMLACETIDFSEGGVGIQLPPGVEVAIEENLTVSLFSGEEEYTFPARVMFNAKGHLGLRFVDLTHQQEFDFVQCTFARADAWIDWAEGRELDTPLGSLARVLKVGARGIWGLFGHLGGDARALRQVASGASKKTKLKSKLDTGH